MPVPHAQRREYMAAYIRQHYADNKTYYQAKATERRKRLAEWFRAYKRTLSCSSCPESHPAALDFHHPDRSENPIRPRYMIMQGWSQKRIEAELEKCVVLCANCHRKLHHEERAEEELNPRPSA